MWPKLAAAGVLLLIQGVVADDCMYTVSVLDVAGVQCVTSAPCSGTYYASGLTQGVGACPTGTSCALLPETPIMGCAASGRTDLVYVNADGSLTKDGKSVTLSGASSATSDSTTTSPSTSSTSSTTSSTTSSSSKSTGSSSSATSSDGSNANANSGSGSTTSDGNTSSASTTTNSGEINPGTVIAGGSDASNSTADSSNSTTSASSAASNSSSSTTSQSWTSDSASGSVTISPGSSSANQQSFNPGSILSDGSNASNTSSQGGLGIGSIIAIVVGCLAVVAIAAGARLLRKGKEAELATPDAAGAMEGYNNGGGGSGMTPKENVLLL